MTINLSSKSSGGGGGNAVSDPRMLPACLTQATGLRLKYGLGVEEVSSQSNFWTRYIYGGTNIVVTTHNTYNTIINITGKSGHVFNMVSPTHYNGGTGEIKFKITVDGTEYIVGPPISTGVRNKRFVLGGFLPIDPMTIDGYATPSSAGSYGDIGYNLSFMNPYYITNCYLTHPFLSVYSGSPYLFFKNSFKLEVLLNLVATTNYYNRAGVNWYTLI